MSCDLRSLASSFYTQICDWPDHELSVDDKLAFFRVTRHTFGRTALLLSGGGGLGIFHLVCMVCAFVCCVQCCAHPTCAYFQRLCFQGIACRFVR
jgi:hypothetical protein